jgi:hypothetical protein
MNLGLLAEECFRLLGGLMLSGQVAFVWYSHRLAKRTAQKANLKFDRKLALMYGFSFLPMVGGSTFILAWDVRGLFVGERLDWFSGLVSPGFLVLLIGSFWWVQFDGGRSWAWLRRRGKPASSEEIVEAIAERDLPILFMALLETARDGQISDSTAEYGRTFLRTPSLGFVTQKQVAEALTAFAEPRKGADPVEAFIHFNMTRTMKAVGFQVFEGPPPDAPPQPPTVH